MKVLAKETAIYGLSSIIGKFISWLLTPMYTYVLVSTQEVGEITNIYAIAALLTVILTYGMETGFFRFINKNGEDENNVYSTTLTSIAFTSLLFLIVVSMFRQPIADLLHYGNHVDYIMLMSVVLALDAFNAIPFAYLRHKKMPIRFATYKLVYIFFSIVLNIFFLVLCPMLHQSDYAFLIDWFYRTDYGVGYVFVANLIGTLIQTFCLIPYWIKLSFRFDTHLWRQMLSYSFPLLILGIAGIMNQTFDKIMMPYLIDDLDEAMHQNGIYGVNSKIAVVLTMFTQAFRFAYEPFVFGKHKEEDGKRSRQAYAEATKYFVICSLLIFVGVCFGLDVIKYIVNEKYWEGLNVVPIIMIGDIFMGIFFNLSVWYKLNDETRWGAYFSLSGFVFIAVINILFVPRYGYTACAWAIFVAYLVMMLLSYFVGQKRYPIDYDLRAMGRYALLALALYAVGMYMPIANLWLRLSFRACLFLLFLAYFIRHDFPLSEIPIINRWVKK